MKTIWLRPRPHPYLTVKKDHLHVKLSRKCPAKMSQALHLMQQKRELWRRPRQCLSLVHNDLFLHTFF